jgi:hypothetical protein
MIFRGGVDQALKGDISLTLHRAELDRAGGEAGAERRQAFTIDN